MHASRTVIGVPFILTRMVSPSPTGLHPGLRPSNGPARSQRNGDQGQRSSQGAGGVTTSGHGSTLPASIFAAVPASLA